MNITIFISALSGGGAERVACNLANHLAQDDNNHVEIITMSDKKDAYGLSNKVCHVPLLSDTERKNAVYSGLIRIWRLFRYMRRRKDIDAYVVMLPVTIILFMALRFATRARVILSERNDPANYTPKMQNLMKHFFAKADGIVFQTEHVSKWYESSLNKACSIVIPNAINPAFIRSAYEGEKENVIAAAGRLNVQKNFPLLIRAFARIADQFPEYKLVIYGQGSLLDSLKSLAEELSVGSRVEFPGYVENMPAKLEKAGMFVLSSDYEGMPNALMEAMALGLPCVSTDCGGGGARFLIEDGVNGLLVPQKDEEAMAAAMAHILSDPRKAAELAENARKLQQTLAPEQIYGEWERFIREIARGEIV